MSKQQALFETDPAPWDLDAERDWLAARVVFPRTPFGPYDYRVPESLRAAVAAGQRLQVPLGRGNRSVVGYCVELIPGDDPRVAGLSLQKVKPVRAVLDKQPLLSPSLLDLARWISARWHCPLGVTLESMVPAGVREQRNTRRQVFLQVDEEALASVDLFKLSPQQQAALGVLQRCPDALTPAELANRAACSSAPISSLRKKGLLRETARRVENRAHTLERVERKADLTLNTDQQAALDQVVGALMGSVHRTILLHGITGSGKTEVYIRAIQRVIEFGRQAIVLVPEISLTPQTRLRFCERFDSVAVLHSNQTASERAWHWRQIASGQVQVVIGARSAVFAPVPRLGLVVLDEEHDASFKQDQAPRYHARQVAEQRTAALGVPLVLGSATPSLESWHLAEQKRYSLVQLPQRILGRPLPDVETIDLRVSATGKSARGAISRQLHAAMHEALSAGGQVILLLNRRGYATAVQCPHCGHVMRCPDCAIALTHHREGKFVMCHYCDYRRDEPSRCVECGYRGVQFWGVGTQRLQQEVAARFPEATCVRMDTDSMHRPGSHERALDDFRAGKTRILLGTQMVAKGLDFPNVTLVGVINADTALHLLDFRAAERTFTLVTQVAGRTGRGPRGGRVLVQTFNPEHPSIVAAVHHDFPAFAKRELENRRDFRYPPFGSLARYVVRGECETAARSAAEQLASAARAAQPPSGKVIGPAEAPLAKLRGKYRFHFLINAPDDDTLHEWVEVVAPRATPTDDLQIVVDIDPLDML